MRDLWRGAVRNCWDKGWVGVQGGIGKAWKWVVVVELMQVAGYESV